MTTFALALALLSSPLIVSTAQAEDAAEQDWSLDDANRLWKMRDWGGHTEAAIAMLEAELEADPSSFEANYQMARFRYWEASKLSGEARAAKARLSWDHAEVCKKLDPSRVEGWYWSSIAIGTYANGVGTMKAVKDGLGEELSMNAKKAIEIDAAHDYGGPTRVMGRFLFKLPWPMQDLDKAATLLEKSNEGEVYAINLVYLAEIYIAQDEEDKARALLEQAAALDPKESPDPPSTRRHSKNAQKLLEEL